MGSRVGGVVWTPWRIEGREIELVDTIYSSLRSASAPTIQAPTTTPSTINHHTPHVIPASPSGTSRSPHYLSVSQLKSAQQAVGQAKVLKHTLLTQLEDAQTQSSSVPVIGEATEAYEKQKGVVRKAGNKVKKIEGGLGELRKERRDATTRATRQVRRPRPRDNVIVGVPGGAVDSLFQRWFETLVKWEALRTQIARATKVVESGEKRVLAMQGLSGVGAVRSGARTVGQVKILRADFEGLMR